MVDLQFWLQLIVVLFCLAVGGRFGGVGLGAAGGFGVSILVLGFDMQPGSPPVSVLLIITAVIACTSVLQGSGGAAGRGRRIPLSRKGRQTRQPAVEF